jgi:hypothetical protein
VKGEITAVVERPFETADAALLQESIADLPAGQQTELEEIYDQGTLRGFQGAILAGGIVALFGALLAFRLPKRKLESDPTSATKVEEVVRNTTLPGLQLEMSDLTVTPDL